MQRKFESRKFLNLQSVVKTQGLVFHINTTLIILQEIVLQISKRNQEYYVCFMPIHYLHDR